MSFNLFKPGICVKCHQIFKPKAPYKIFAVSLAWRKTFTGWISWCCVMWTLLISCKCFNRLKIQANEYFIRMSSNFLNIKRYLWNFKFWTVLTIPKQFFIVTSKKNREKMFCTCSFFHSYQSNIARWFHCKCYFYDFLSICKRSPNGICAASLPVDVISIEWLCYWDINHTFRYITGTFTLLAIWWNLLSNTGKFTLNSPQLCAFSSIFFSFVV